MRALIALLLLVSATGALAQTITTTTSADGKTITTTSRDWTAETVITRGSAGTTSTTTWSRRGYNPMGSGYSPMGDYRPMGN